MLARDIYRDLYEEPGPTLGEKLALAGKRLAFTLAGGALLLAALDFAGVHSLPGVDSLLQSARTKVTGDKPRQQKVAAKTHDMIRVTIPKAASKALERQPSAIDELAAAGRKDAIALAMTSSTLILPALDTSSARPAPAAATPVKTVPSVASIAAIATVATTRPQAPAQEAVNVADRTPAQLSALPSTTSPVELPEIAAKSQASVPPAAELQLASLTTPALTQEPAIATAPVSIPLSEVPLPRPASPLSPADRLNLTGEEYARAERCLTDAIYFEARSEPIRGQMAVAQVVLNRVFSGFYPHDVCGVVYQNANRRLACQFTFACDGKPEVVHDRRHWAIAKRIARKTLDGQIYVPEVGKSTHYHASYVRPNWVREMRRLVRFGVHSFYRPYAWGNGAEEPVWGKAGTVARVHRTAAR